MILARPILPLLLVWSFAGNLPAADCNQNGTPDVEDLLSGRSEDCNQNFVPDECDLLPRSAVFEVVSTLPAGVRPFALATVDLEGDGDTDLVATNQDSNDVTVLIKEGGGFLAGDTLAVGRQPVAAAAGDLDGDGDDDVLISNFSDSTVSLLENDGAGNLTATSFDTAVGLARLSLSDLDSDGDLDLAGTDLNAYVRVFFNDGAGAFMPPELVFAGDSTGRPLGIVSGDLDEDGDFDLCTANLQNSYRGVSILWNDGAGSFALDENLVLEETYPFAAAASDVDADGDLDILAVNASRLSVLLNEGGGTFGLPSAYPHGSPEVPATTALRQVACADLTGDGFLDAAVVDSGPGGLDTGGAHVFFGAGDGTFSGPRTFRAGNKPFDLAILEIDGDGRADIVTSNWLSGDVTVLKNAVASNSADCDSSGVPDECEPDCDEDGIPDSCEISDGTATDSNGNGLPDGCEPDCNGNGILDDVDLSSGTSKDCNYNLVPDECDVAPALGFASASGYAVGEYALDLVAADLDGNGTNDLAVLGAASEDVTILLNTGERSFRESRRYFAGLRPVTLASGDLDGDEDIDLAVANHWSRDVVVFRNTGEGKFIRGVPLPGFDSPHSFEAADMDGDGDLDLVLGSPKGHFVAVYWNSGGSFRPFIEIPVNVDPAHIWVMDMDGDADLDLTISDENPGNFTEVVFNLGGGEFDSLGDGQGKDPVFLTEAGMAVMAGHLGGGEGLDFAALDKDSALPGRVIVLLDTPSGSVERTQVLEPVGGALDLILGDVDQDEDLDLIVAGVSVNLFANDGTGVFTHRGSFKAPDIYGEIIAADLDDDGALDFAATGLPDQVWVLWNRGDGRSPAMNTYETGQQTRSVVIDDFDMDGDFDVAAAPYSSLITLLENSGSGTFDSSRSLLLPGDPDNLVSGDFTGDGYPDLALSATDAQVAVFPSAGGGAFDKPQGYTAGDRISDVAAADLDGDGDLDLAASSMNTPDLSLLYILNRGDGTFDNPGAVAVGASQTSVAATDFDGDGSVDLAVAIEGSRIPAGLSFHWGMGSAEFTPGTGRPQYLTENSVSRLLATDLDNDAILDVVSADVGGSAVSVFRNLGNGTFAPRGAFNAGDEPLDLAGGDLDRDGHVDLAVASRDSRSLNVLRNKGDGTFGAATAFPVGGTQWSVALGYLDGDGDLDVAVAFWETGEVGIFSNQASEVSVIDCDQDGITDMFQVGASRDCNGNDIADEIDIHARRSVDEDADGIPDECQRGRAVFHRGDANADGAVNITDSLFIFGFLFLGTEGPTCLEAANSNNEGRVDITDGISILSYLFLGTKPPAMPGAPPSACGPDPDEPGSPRDLGCGAYAGCEPAP
jgi:hypothetical protein